MVWFLIKEQGYEEKKGFNMSMITADDISNIAR
jgi:hypothetical protein